MRTYTTHMSNQKTEWEPKHLVYVKYWLLYLQYCQIYSYVCCAISRFCVFIIIVEWVSIDICDNCNTYLSNNHRYFTFYLSDIGVNYTVFHTQYSFPTVLSIAFVGLENVFGGFQVVFKTLLRKRPWSHVFIWLPSLSYLCVRFG